jgi:hypothetical protein
VIRIDAVWLAVAPLDMRAGQRAAAVMSLLQSARLNGLHPYSYSKDVLTRLPTQPAGRSEDLLPHRWQAAPHADPLRAHGGVLPARLRHASFPGRAPSRRQNFGHESDTGPRNVKGVNDSRR